MFRWKGIYTLAVFILLLLFVAACGNGEPTNSDQTNGETSSRTIKHAMGETKIPGTPQRIVVLTNQGTETLLELGIKPVGAVKSWIGDPWYDHIKDKMIDVKVVGDETQPNIELIASLKPDIILGTKVRHEKIYKQLSSIAPTVFTENLGNSMVENFKLFAQALNKENEGTAVLDDYSKTIEQAKERLGDKTKLHVSLARFQPGKVRVYYKDNFAGVILNQLGFSRPDAQNKDKFSEDITKEQMEVLNGDVFFYFTSDREGDYGATQTADEWLKDPLAQNLDIIKKNRAFKVNEPIWNTSGGIISAKLLIKDIEARFANLTIE